MNTAYDPGSSFTTSPRRNTRPLYFWKLACHDHPGSLEIVSKTCAASRCPITFTSKKQPTIALSSGEAEFLASLSGAYEGMGQRQQWDCLRKFGDDAEETCSTSQQVQKYDSSAAVSMIQRRESTRKTRHTELKAFSYISGAHDQK